TVVIVTHDTEFAAKTADRCALLFRGEIMSEGTPREFFGSNAFYTTPASRMTRGIYKNAVTVEDVSELLRINGRRS
ncbi:MAG: ABC transporter ATP-binding protein, partial [Lachnospiraceae bacterium]|nr:ABC transporter ATP-binding protein [Lachnospiraceae bacterium]